MGRGTARKYLASVEWLRDAKLATMAECVNVALRLCAVRCPLHFKKVDFTPLSAAAIFGKLNAYPRKGLVSGYGREG